MGYILEGNFTDIISNTSNSIERNINQNKYTDYIKTHKKRVKIAYEKYFLPLLDKELDLQSCSTEEFKEAIKSAINNINTHDESKYTDIEFEPYRVRFYPTTEEKELLKNPDYFNQQQENFLIAWEHHYKNNPHHPKYWVKEDGTIINMELVYIIEMICDWASFGDDTLSWYQNKAIDEKKAMSARTKEIVEELLGILFK
jgi:hypothetical protein